VPKDVQYREPKWAETVIPWAEAAERLGKHLAHAAGWFGAVLGVGAVLILVGWVVIGAITGYVPSQGLLSAGGAGTIAGAIWKVLGKDNE
jgi:hypothetical protein